MKCWALAFGMLMVSTATAAAACHLMVPKAVTEQAKLVGCPEETARFVERAGLCQHFAGEEPYDAERQAFIEKSINELGCSHLPRDYKTIKERYALQAGILKAVTDGLHHYGVEPYYVGE